MTQILKRIERELEARYRRDLTYAVHYGSGWERASESYDRLRGFKESLSQRAESRTAKEESAHPLAA